MGKFTDALEKIKTEQNLPAESSRQPDPDPVAFDSGRSGMDRNLVSFLRPRSFEAEQFKMLKTNIMFPAKGEQPARVIMITSAVPGEGKTFVASNLAISMAQNIDNHVLLIDCDLRLPSIHSRFGLGEPPGLSEYLSKDADLSSLLQKTEMEKLTILPGGAPPSNPYELLSSKQMSAFIKEVKTRYSDRYIIIDTAPPQLTAEGNALSRLVDGIILVVNFERTGREAVLALVNALGKERILGVVPNRFNQMVSGYYSGYNKYENYYNQKQ